MPDVTRSSSSVDRVASLLNFLAAHPSDSFSISELGRRLDISKATCHALVGSLLNAGFVRRDPRERRISVGPALIAIGVAAAGKPKELVEYASDEMKFLASKYDAQCGATMAVGDEIVVLETFGSPASLATSLHVGQRLPHRPPLGAIYVAWAPPEERAEWLARQVNDGIDYDKVLDVIRQRGFSIALEIAPWLRVEQAFHEFRGDEPLDTVASKVAAVLQSLQLEEYYVFDIDDHVEYNVRHIAVPVFQSEGQIAFVITLTSFGRNLAGQLITSAAQEMTAAAKRITKSLMGEVRAS